MSRVREKGPNATEASGRNHPPLVEQALPAAFSHRSKRNSARVSVQTACLAGQKDKGVRFLLRRALLFEDK